MIDGEVGYVPFHLELAKLMYPVAHARRRGHPQRPAPIMAADAERRAPDPMTTAPPPAEILSLRGDSFRLRGKDLACRQAGEDRE